MKSAPLFCLLALALGSGCLGPGHAAKPAAAAARVFEGAPLIVPAYTAYVAPTPNSVSVDEKTGVTKWHDPSLRVSWFGQLGGGRLDAVVALRLPAGVASKLRLTVGGEQREATAIGKGEELVVVGFPGFTIATPSTVELILESLNAPEQPAGDLEDLRLYGPSTAGAHFSHNAKRDAPSVHLWYPVSSGKQVEVFYNEVTPLLDPPATFYMACGFTGGYFGMQVGGKNERQILFSVWNAGDEKVDPSKVPEDNRVTMLAKGDSAVASEFGHEGTGQHASIAYAWTIGQTQRFAVTAKPDGDRTDYTAHWYHPGERRWLLVASFRKPHDGKSLRGLYSFVENYGTSTGQAPRKALFGPQWIRTVTGWEELTTASFTFTELGKERLDRSGGVENGRFFLANGGFVPGVGAYDEKFTHPAGARPVELAALP